MSAIREIRTRPLYTTRSCPPRCCPARHRGGCSISASSFQSDGGPRCDRGRGVNISQGLGRNKTSIVKQAGGRPRRLPGARHLPSRDFSRLWFSRVNFVTRSVAGRIGCTRWRLDLGAANWMLRPSGRRVTQSDGSVVPLHAGATPVPARDRREDLKVVSGVGFHRAPAPPDGHDGGGWTTGDAGGTTRSRRRTGTGPGRLAGCRLLLSRPGPSRPRRPGRSRTW